MRKILGFFFGLLAAIPCLAQRTIVSGTITDPSGTPYAGGTIQATLTLPVGASGAILNGVQVNGVSPRVTLDPTGSFLFQLPDNALVQCTNAQGQIIACVPQTQWRFDVNISPGAPLPLGAGPQSCGATLTISGTSQSISSSFSCPLLSRIAAGPAASTFNVKSPAFGAKGDAQGTGPGACSLTGGSAIVNCTGTSFQSSSDPGKRFNCGLGVGFGLFFPRGTTILSVQSPTAITASNTSAATNTANCSWGTVDDVAIQAAVTAWQAAIFAGTGQGNQFINPNPGKAPILYFPTGGYLVCGNANGVIFQPPNTGGARVEGDAPEESVLMACDNAVTPSGANGFFINQASAAGPLEVNNLTFDGSNFTHPAGAPPALLFNGSHYTENLHVKRYNFGTPFTSQGNGYNLNLVTDTSSGPLTCFQCSDEFRNGGSSNNGSFVNLRVQNTVGLNSSTGPRFTGNFLVDECGASPYCASFENAHDVWLQGASIFGTPGGACAHIDQNSFVHWNGGICGVFGTDTNTSGPLIDAGGTLEESDVRNVGTGTGKCATVNGRLLDNGSNTCENQFPIASGSSSGTTATLTLTTLGANVNTNCSVSDSLVVQGINGPAGYDGYWPFAVTAVTATTLSYTTISSNMGAAGAGGVAFCRNLQTYSGNLPRALLNNPIPNTCYITGTFAATVTGAPMCNFKAQSATNIAFIKASSTTVTACTVAPVLTISDGTVSVTLTLTTGKSQWDSSVDASTGVGTTIFKPNGTVQVTNTAGTCTTPPTNFAVSYNVAPILSN